MIAIIDYGAGNLFSVKNALDYLGLENKITKDADDLRKADRLILPGVGAFADAMRMLNESGLVDVIREEVQKKPLLGICLGMQMLFEKGYEFGETDGLGLIKGCVKLMEPEGSLAIPHIGWNKLEKNEPCSLLDKCGDGEYVYFVHSYAAECDSKNVAAYCDYGMKVPALVFEGNVFGAQFHPEKSGETGLNILRCFAAL
ncbi:MAG: imidazole glycerol phosphate synthase subunit HisH [Oscillospiraceae bacterium]|nr:imidazole glycerol phosphate synthase subunit HisH [Oscillospiraceae bacterium]